MRIYCKCFAKILQNSDSVPCSPKAKRSLYSIPLSIAR